METRLPFSFEDMGYGRGELQFYMNSCDEETPLLAQIRYPERFDIIVEHSGARVFRVSLYWDIENHCPPVAVYHTDDIMLLEKALMQAAERADREVDERRFSYYGPLWETEHIRVT